MSAEIPPRIITDILFVGRGGGQVKALSGFKKSHHTLPDAVTPATQAFFAKLCASEVAADGEVLFQAVRTALGYKRKDVSLSVASPSAVLTAKDFVVEITYALREPDPAQFEIATSLHSLCSADLARTSEFEKVFARRFSELSFALRKGVQIEQVIDAVEDLEESTMRVSYPSDYAHCEIEVPGVDARVRCTSGSVDLLFPRAGSPAELIDAFVSVREAFRVSPDLAGLLG